MVSEDNLAFLRQRAVRTSWARQGMLKRFEQYLVDRDWHESRPGRGEAGPGPAGDETFILARSADRRKKEEAMHERFVVRMEAGLEKAEEVCGFRSAGRRRIGPGASGAAQRAELAGQ